MKQESILVLTKEKLLGTRCTALLKKEGFSCEHLLVDRGLNEAKLLEALSKRSKPTLIVAQFRMSPYTAIELLNDLARAALSDRIDVIALVLEGELGQIGVNEFIRNGGAAVANIKPGGGELLNSLRDAIRQVTSFREKKQLRESQVIDFLSSIGQNEAKFRRFAVELFQELGFHEVRETDNATEHGKDLVFHELNRLGELEFVGVQAKAVDVQAGPSSEGNLTELWLQAIEALSSEVEHGGELYPLDKLVFLASGKINEHARKKLVEHQKHHRYNKRVFFYDQIKLAKLVAKHAPLLVMKYG